MGQRLNIEIMKSETLLANSYYHWSGYTSCAINMIVNIIKNFDYIKRYKMENVKDKDILFAVKLLEETGAGMTDIEKKELFKKIGLIDENVKINQCKGRSEGIINITKNEMQDNRYWEEGRVTIDIENKKIKFEVFYNIEKDEKDEYEEDGYKFEEINIDFNNIDFENVFDIKAFIDKACYKEQYYFKNNFNNAYIGLIE